MPVEELVLDEQLEQLFTPVVSEHSMMDIEDVATVLLQAALDEQRLGT
jgi:hypothetical protein